MFEIEKNVPLPPSPAEKAAWKAMVPDMEIGDSILTDQKDRRGTCLIFTAAARRAGNGYRAATAMEGEFVRVWRIS